MKNNFQERLEISRFLEDGNSLFRQFWDIGSVKFVDKSITDTAAITFDKTGSAINFVFNEEFYDSIDPYTKAFITAHEMLHILLNHGKRMLVHKNDTISNKTMDIVVNHLLVSDFGFDREKLCIDWKNYCWVDTVFEEPNVPLKGRSYEYYYNLLNTLGDDTKTFLLDSHGVTSEGSGQISDKLSEELSSCDFDDRLKKIIEEHGVSDSAGAGIGKYIDLNPPKIKQNKAWSKIVKPTTKVMKYGRTSSKSWIRNNRRVEDILSKNKNIFLKTESKFPNYYYEYSKTKILLFLDFSGSCAKYYQDFLDASYSLETNKFIVRRFLFDVSCKEIFSASDKLPAGGGTNFKCIENTIKDIDEDEYDYVFIITDGFSSYSICPHDSEKWHWFLTESSTRSKIGGNPTFHELEDFLV